MSFHDEDDYGSSWIEQKLPCDDCGSSDARYVNSRGWSKCFSCKKSKKVYGDDEAANSPKRTGKEHRHLQELIGDISYDGIKARGLSAETCRKFGYGTGTYKGAPVHVANIQGNGSVVAQKLRTRDKEFVWLGNRKKADPLFGMHLWPARGKKVVITEGEIDCMSVSQVQNNQWPVVSLPDGVDSARKALQKAREWLEGYEQIILMFDEDEPGRKAIEEVAMALPAGKVYVAKLPRKDANECLMKGDARAIIKAIFDAAPWRPDAVFAGKELWERVEHREGAIGVPPGFKHLEAFIPKLPLPSLVTILAGTGSGKTTLCKVIEHHLIKSGENVGILHLEESIEDTAQGLMGLELGVHLGEGVHVEPEEKRRAFDATIGREGVYVYDNFGSMDPDTVIGKIRYMATVGQCRYIILDHITIMLSGLSGDNGTKELDRVMTQLVSLAKELGICIIMVSHLTKSDKGKPFEEGAQISLQNARGSQGIAQLSYIVLAVERNQQAEDVRERDLITLRVLKNRPFRKTGVACKLLYDHDTGKLIDFPASYEVVPPDDFDADESGVDL